MLLYRIQINKGIGRMILGEKNNEGLSLLYIPIVVNDDLTFKHMDAGMFTMTQTPVEVIEMYINNTIKRLKKKDISLVLVSDTLTILSKLPVILPKLDDLRVELQFAKLQADA